MPFSEKMRDRRAWGCLGAAYSEYSNSFNQAVEKFGVEMMEVRNLFKKNQIMSRSRRFSFLLSSGWLQTSKAYCYSSDFTCTVSYCLFPLSNCPTPLSVSPSLPSVHSGLAKMQMKKMTRIGMMTMMTMMTMKTNATASARSTLHTESCVMKTGTCFSTASAPVYRYTHTHTHAPEP